jgi:phosphatidate cytidylyltransferase
LLYPPLSHWPVDSINRKKGRIMHLKRWLTAMVAIPFLVAVIIKAPPMMFAAFIGLVALIALKEYYPLAAPVIDSGDRLPIAAWGMITGAAVVGATAAGIFHLVPGILLINLMIAAMLSMPAYGKHPKILILVSAQLQGLIYIPLSLSTILLLRAGTDGTTWIFFLLFIVFSGDVGAFYAGRFFGRHKLSPAISPGKTIEGSVGSALTSIVVGFGFYSIFLPHLNLWTVLALLVFVNASAQAGDLFESQLKRSAGIKDSGSILPGHGGMLDRIDALLFAAPIAWVFKTFMAGV